MEKQTIRIKTELLGYPFYSEITAPPYIETEHLNKLMQKVISDHFYTLIKTIFSAGVHEVLNKNEKN